MRGRRILPAFCRLCLSGTHLVDVASEGSLCVAAVQEPQHTRWYVRIPGTADAQNGERSSL